MITFSVATVFGKNARVVASRMHTCRCGQVVMVSEVETDSCWGWTTDVHDGCSGEWIVTGYKDSEKQRALESLT